MSLVKSNVATRPRLINQFDAFVWNYYEARQFYFHGSPISAFLGDNAPIKICGIPDGVPPNADFALVDNNAKSRLYIFSQRPLQKHELEALDNRYGRDNKYPLLSISKHLADVTKNKYDFFEENFYVSLSSSQESSPQTNSRFVECRFFEQRHMMTTKLLVHNSTHNISLFNLVLPRNSTQMALIMPRNFKQTGPRSGYFEVDRSLFVRIYSEYCLISSSLDRYDHKLITKINTNDSTFLEHAKHILSRLKLNHTTVHNNQIISKDEFVVAIIGQLNNFVHHAFNN